MPPKLNEQFITLQKVIITVVMLFLVAMFFITKGPLSAIIAIILFLAFSVHLWRNL